MRIVCYIVLGILGILTVLLVIGATKLEKQQLEQEWAWMHPPDDDDGCSVMETDLSAPAGASPLSGEKGDRNAKP